MGFPRMAKIKQIFDKEKIKDIKSVIHKEMERVKLKEIIKPSARIAITAGSRGINNLIAITRAVVDEVKAAGGNPFVMPAMGSHGEATDEGQLNLLRDLGINEESMGVPIISSMEVVELGKVNNQFPVYFSKTAYDSDGIIAINRVKPHTAFRGKIESGLIKILTVGLGKHKGAEMMHAVGLGDNMVKAGRVMLKKAPIILGVAILENSYDETKEIYAAKPDEFEETDTRLLEKSNALLPRIPFYAFDILIVEQMGKNISGTGMDVNIIGIGKRFGGKIEACEPYINTLIVLDLTPETHGNALGIGHADLTTRKLVNKIDFKSSYTNIITTGLWSSGRIPITLENDKEAIEVALRKLEPAKAKVVRIKNTLHLEEIYVSEALLEELKGKPDIEILSEPREMQFDASGNLI